MKITKAGQRIGKRVGKKTGGLEVADADADVDADKTALTPADFSLENLEVTVEQDGPAIWSVYVTISGITSLLITSASPNGPFAVKGLLDRLWEERAVLREQHDKGTHDCHP